MNRIWVLGDQYFSCAVSCSLFFDVLDYKVTPNQKKKNYQTHHANHNTPTKKKFKQTKNKLKIRFF